MRALLLAALLLVPLPPAAVGASDALEVAPLHVGDRLLYRSATTETVLDENGEDATAWLGRIPWTGEVETLVTIEGRARARDEYGVERDTVAFRIERARSDRLVAVERCHVEPAMGWALRWEYLDGGPRYTNEWQFRGEGPVFGEATQFYNTSPPFELRRGPCDGYWEPGYADFREGERPHIGWHFRGTPTLPEPRFARESEPASRTMWNGFAAMEYVFPMDESTGPDHRAQGVARLVFADGFPGPVVVEVDVTETTPYATWTQRGVRELVGYAAGAERFPYDMPWREHPERSPVARFVAQDVLTLPDDALALAYPYKEALTAMRADPALGLREYLWAHPKAALIYAEYEARMASPQTPLVGGAPRASGAGVRARLDRVLLRGDERFLHAHGAPSRRRRDEREGGLGRLGGARRAAV